MLTDQEYYARLRARRQIGGLPAEPFGRAEDRPFHQSQMREQKALSEFTGTVARTMLDQKAAQLVDPRLEPHLYSLLHQSKMQALHMLGNLIADSYFRSLYRTGQYQGVRQLSIESLHAVYERYASQLETIFIECEEKLRRYLTYENFDQADELIGAMLSQGNAQINDYLFRASMDAQRIALTDAQIASYRFIATDSNTCRSCNSLNQRVIDMQDLVVGVNFPPVHPHCRCRVEPVTDHQPDENSFITYLLGIQDYLQNTDYAWLHLYFLQYVEVVSKGRVFVLNFSELVSQLCPAVVETFPYNAYTFGNPIYTSIIEAQNNGLSDADTVLEVWLEYGVIVQPQVIHTIVDQRHKENEMLINALRLMEVTVEKSYENSDIDMEQMYLYKHTIDQVILFLQTGKPVNFLANMKLRIVINTRYSTATRQVFSSAMGLNIFTAFLDFVLKYEEGKISKEEIYSYLGDVAKDTAEEIWKKIEFPAQFINLDKIDKLAGAALLLNEISGLFNEENDRTEIAIWVEKDLGVSDDPYDKIEDPPSYSFNAIVRPEGGLEIKEYGKSTYDFDEERFMIEFYYGDWYDFCEVEVHREVM